MPRHKPTKAELLINSLRALLVIVIVGAAIWYFASGRRFSVDAILSWTPSNWTLATLFILLLYAVKSIVFFLPIMALQIAVGLYFPTWAAMLVNLAGVALELNIPYWIGRKLGFGSADKLFRKFPKLSAIFAGNRSKWFISYILRAVNMLPIDLVSMYLGSLKFPYLTYFSGSMTGMLFGILSTTLLGRALTDPTSPMFIFACLLSCTIAGLSMLAYHRIGRKAPENEASD